MFIGMTSKTQVKTNKRKCHLKTRFGRIKGNILSIKTFSSFLHTPLSPSRFFTLPHSDSAKPEPGSLHSGTFSSLS